MYPEAYARAVDILKKEFGAAAVEKGIVSIPNVPISVPYNSEALVFRRGEPAYYVCVDGGEGSVLRLQYSQPCKAARVPASVARNLIAEYLYLTSMAVDVPGGAEACERQRGVVRSRVGVATPNAAFWHTPYGPWSSPVTPFERRVLDAVENVFALVADRWVETLESQRGMELSAQREDTGALAIAALLRQPGENVLVRDFGRSLLEPAVKAQLPALKRLDRRYHSRWHERLANLPLVGPRLQGVFGGVELCCCGRIWAIEELDGRTEEGQFEKLIEAASGDTSRWPDRNAVQSYATQLLTQRSREHPALAVEHYGKMPSHHIFAPEGAPLVTDEALLRLGASDPEPGVRVAALGRLHDVTKDASCIEALEALAHPGATDQTEPDAEAAAMCDLMRIYRSDATAGDIPGFARQVLAEYYAAPPPENVTSDRVRNRIAWFLLDVPGPEAEAMARELLFEPEKHPAVARYLPFYRKGANTVSLILEYLAARGLSDDKKLVQSAVRQLGYLGDTRAVAFLEAMIEKETERRKAAGERAPTSKYDDIVRYMRGALSRIALANAADRVSLLRNMSPADLDTLARWDMRKHFSDDELRAIIADERFTNARRVALEALGTAPSQPFQP